MEIIQNKNYLVNFLRVLQRVLQKVIPDRDKIIAIMINFSRKEVFISRNAMPIAGKSADLTKNRAGGRCSIKSAIDGLAL